MRGLKLFWQKLTKKLKHLDLDGDNLDGGGLSGLWLASSDLRDMVNNVMRSRDEMKHAQHVNKQAMSHLENTIDSLKVKARKQQQFKVDTDETVRQRNDNKR